jgi:hypothetical protein
VRRASQGLIRVRSALDKPLSVATVRLSVNWADTPLWLRALLGVAGLAAGMAAHLKWHPLRRQFSEAFDLLKFRPHVLVIGGTLILAQRLAGSDGLGPLPDPHDTNWMVWSGLALPLLIASAERFALLLHQALPAWPAALLLPAALTVALFHLARQPYRAGLRQRPRAGVLVLLAALAVILATVTGFEKLAPPELLREWQVNFFLVTRLGAISLLTAGTQIWLLRVVLRWQQPPARRSSKKAASNAWWEMLGRWPLVLGLGAFNLIWIALRFWLLVAPSRVLPWLLLEWLLVFAALPVAIALAAPGNSFFRAGGESLRLLWRSLLPLLGLALTAVVILALAAYADGVAATLSIGAPALRLALDTACAFALAFIHIWLFLAAALTLLRHLPPAPSDSPPSPSQE